MKHAIAILALGVLAGCDIGEPRRAAGRLPICKEIDCAKYKPAILVKDGCEFVYRRDNGQLEPRLNPDGTQVCTQKDERE